MEQSSNLRHRSANKAKNVDRTKILYNDDIKVPKTKLPKSLNNVHSKYPLINDETTQWWICYITITILAFITRLYKIEQPNHVWLVYS